MRVSVDDHQRFAFGISQRADGTSGLKKSYPTSTGLIEAAEVVGCLSQGWMEGFGDLSDPIGGGNFIENDLRSGGGEEAVGGIW